MKKLFLGVVLAGSLSCYAVTGMNTQDIEGTYENLSIPDSKYELKVEKDILRIKNSNTGAENLISLRKDCTEDSQSSGLLPYDLPFARIVREFKTCTNQVGVNSLEGTITKKQLMKVFYFFNESAEEASAAFKIVRSGDDISVEIEQLDENQDKISFEKMVLAKYEI